MARVSADKREHYSMERREQVLDAAVEVFGRMGFDGANVDDIARAAGISKGTVYLYFRSKEEVFKAILAERTLLPHLPELMSGAEGESLAETLGKIGRAYYAYMHEHLSIARLLGDATRFPACAEQVYVSVILRGNEALAGLLTAQARAGKIRSSADTFLAARAFMGMLLVYIFTQELLNGQQYTPLQESAWIDEVVRIFLDGIRA